MATTVGFMLLLVLGILAMVVYPVLRERREKTLSAREMSSRLEMALKRYVDDEAELPGVRPESAEDRNDFPLLFTALFGQRRPLGRGGRSAPYMRIRSDEIAVWDQEEDKYQQAKPEQIQDDSIQKYLLDPWGNPYVYRVITPKRAGGGLRHVVQMYSMGPNGLDDTRGANLSGDDISADAVPKETRLWLPSR